LVKAVAVAWKVSDVNFYPAGEEQARHLADAEYWEKQKKLKTGSAAHATGICYNRSSLQAFLLVPCGDGNPYSQRLAKSASTPTAELSPGSD
jgi:hypothetical protein